MPDMNLGDTALIERECLAHGCDANQTAYILATAYWETARTMKPVVEAFWLSEDWRRRNLRYYPWHGRGYVQLTWEANYIKAGDKLGLDLTSDPGVVMQPEVAAQILVQGMMEGWFTGKKLPDYAGNGKKNYLDARRVVNGTDKARAIAELAREYEAAIKAKPLPEPRSSPTQSTTLRAAVGVAVTGATGTTTAISQLEGAAQLIVIGAGALAGLFVLWIFRERLRKWAEGDR